MTAVGLAMWLVGEALFRWLLPEYAFGLYPAIPALFIAFGLTITWLSARWERRIKEGALTSQKAVGYFMLARMVKLLVSLAAMVCYVQFSGEPRGPFIVTFLIYYLVFLGMETIDAKQLTNNR